MARRYVSQPSSEFAAMWAQLPPAEQRRLMAEARAALEAVWGVPRLANKAAAAEVYEQQSEDYPPGAISWLHHAMWKGPVCVQLSHITPDMKLMDGTDPAHVAEFADLLKQGETLKPVVLVSTPGRAKLQLVDGHHRYKAYKQLGRPVNGYIGSVDSEHGGWETMHAYQFPPSSAGGSGGAQARRTTVFNRADPAREARADAAFSALAATMARQLKEGA